MFHLQTTQQGSLGPNIFLGVPGCVTKEHEDVSCTLFPDLNSISEQTNDFGFSSFFFKGEGTVDSWHFNCQGFNEVVIHQKLTEPQKSTLMKILRADSSELVEIEKEFDAKELTYDKDWRINENKASCRLFYYFRCFESRPN